MNTTKEFDALKRKVYLAYHQDGILDLVAGSVVLGFGTFMLTDNIAFLMAGWFMMMLYVFLKNRITVPRFGFVRIDSEKKALMKSWISVGIGVLVLLLFFLLPIFLRSGTNLPRNGGLDAPLSHGSTEHDAVRAACIGRGHLPGAETLLPVRLAGSGTAPARRSA